MRSRGLSARTGSVRLRTTTAAVLVVGITLGLSAVGLSVLLRRSLVLSLRTATELRSADVASLIRQARLPASLPQVGDDQALVEVFDSAGREVAASSELQGSTRLPQFLPADRALLTRIVEKPEFDDEEDFVVTARRVASEEGDLVVYAAASLDNTDETMATVNGALIVGVPLMLAAFGFTSWVVMGRVLHPVEAMRAEVAEITARDLSRRVPERGSEDELGRLARTMNGMLDRLQAAADRQHRFVADASHELQTPLASARAQLEVGLVHPGATDWPATARDVLDEHERMERLVQDLLFLARNDEAGPPARRTRLDLDDVVLREAERVRERARVAVDLSRVSGGQVVGDPDQLLRVVRNLLSNAERHARSTVTVELGAENAMVELVVADDGEGIPAEHRGRVFERFTRLDPGRARDEGGTGLGLAIAKEIVESHGGTIGVLDGDGTRIAVRLPGAPA